MPIFCDLNNASFVVSADEKVARTKNEEIHFAVKRFASLSFSKLSTRGLFESDYHCAKRPLTRLIGRHLNSESIYDRGRKDSFIKRRFSHHSGRVVPTTRLSHFCFCLSSPFARFKSSSISRSQTLSTFSLSTETIDIEFSVLIFLLSVSVSLLAMLDVDIPI